MVTTHVTRKARFARGESEAKGMGRWDGEVGWGASKEDQNGIHVLNCPIVGHKLTLQGPKKARKCYNSLCKHKGGMGIMKRRPK
jgi:hypothetical protein